MTSEFASAETLASVLDAPLIYVDRHPVVHRLRAQDPVHFAQRLQSWLLLRYDDVSAALRDARLGHTGAQTRISRLAPKMQQALHPLKRSIDHWMGPPTAEDHACYRKVLSAHLTLRSVSAFRPRIEWRFENALEQACAGGRSQIDAVHEVALPVRRRRDRRPDRALGREHRRSAQLVARPRRGLPGEQPRDPAARAGEPARPRGSEPLLDRSARRRRRGRSHLHILAGKKTGLIYGDEEIIAHCVALMFVGFETTSNLIAGGLYHLRERPSELEKLRTSPERLNSAMDEMLRRRFHLARRPRGLRAARPRNRRPPSRACSLCPACARPPK